MTTVFTADCGDGDADEVTIDVDTRFAAAGYGGNGVEVGIDPMRLSAKTIDGQTRGETIAETGEKPGGDTGDKTGGKIDDKTGDERGNKTGYDTGSQIAG